MAEFQGIFAILSAFSIDNRGGGWDGEGWVGRGGLGGTGRGGAGGWGGRDVAKINLRDTP